MVLSQLRVGQPHLDSRLVSQRNFQVHKLKLLSYMRFMTEQVHLFVEMIASVSGRCITQMLYTPYVDSSICLID